MLNVSLKLPNPELPVDAWLGLCRLGAWRIVRCALRFHCLGPPRLCGDCRARGRGNETRRANAGWPRESRSFASSSAPRRDRASVTFGLGAEVLPAGSARCSSRYSVSTAETGDAHCRRALSRRPSQGSRWSAGRATAAATESRASAAGAECSLQIHVKGAATPTSTLAAFRP